jgi:hypothetical protein
MGSAGLKFARQLAHSGPLPLGTDRHVMDERDHAPRLAAAVDAIMKARSGPPPERPVLIVSSA